jgi:2,3-dihydroxybenzoate decarboxylase
MTTKSGSRVIALEEHYWDPGVAEHFTGRNATRSSDLLDRLYDLGGLRLKEMDDAGIDVQVLSHGAPSTQRLSRRCRPRTRPPRRTSWSVASPTSASRAR